MTPVKVEIKNFLGIRSLEFDFKPGIYVLVGRNGSGKSSFFEAIFFALFGSGIRYGQNTVKPYIRRESNSLKVSFRFKRAGKEYEIIREASMKGSKAILFEITEGGGRKRIASEVTAVNKKIEGILQIDRDTFAKTFLIPQGEIDNLAKESKKGIRNLIMKISGFDERKKEIREKLNNYLKEINSKLKAEAIKALNDKLKEFGTEEELKERIKFLAKNKEELAKEIKKLEKSINELKIYEILYKKKEALEKLRNEKVKLERLAEMEKKAEEVEKLKPHLNIVEDKKKELSRKKKELSSYMSELEKVKERKEYMKEKLMKEMENYERHKERLSLLESKKDGLKKIVDSVKDLIEELQNVTAGERLYKEELEKLEKEKKSIEDKINESEKRLEKLLSSFRNVEREKEELEKLEVEWMVAKISESLKDGDTCPVCGSIYKKSHNITREVSFPQERYKKIIEKWEKLKDNITAIKERIEIEKVNLKDTEKVLNDKTDAYRSFLEKKDKIKETLKEKGYYRSIEKDINELEDNIKSLRELLEREYEMFNEHKREYDVMEERIKNLKDRIQRCREEIKLMEEEISAKKTFIELELERIGIKENELEKYTRFKKQNYIKRLTKVNTQIAEYEKDIKGVGEDIDDMKRKLSALHKKHEEYKNRLERINQEIGETQSALKQVKSLKDTIARYQREMEGLIKEEEVVNKLLNVLNASNFDDYFFEMKFKPVVDIANVELFNLTNGMFQLTLDEKRNLVVIRNDRNGEEFPIDALSGGEKTLVSLALAIAISESFVGNVGALFIDEGFSALDYYNREKIAEILKKYESLGRVIIFITHFEDLSSKFANVIRMENGERVA